MPSSTSFFLIVFCVCATQEIVVKDQHSLIGPFEGQAEDILRNWYLTGSAQMDQYGVQLTQDKPDQRGAIWNTHSCQSIDWEFQLDFHIHGKGINLFGDGMAMWYVKDPLHQGPVFGSKNFFSGLGIFIDTFENEDQPHRHRHPYISGMVNNGSVRYDHDEDGTYTQIGGCHVPVRNLQQKTRIAVTYMHDTLTVYHDTVGLEQWVQCFSSSGVHLPTGYFFGVSSSTGEFSDNHDVRSVMLLDMNFPREDVEGRKHIIPSAEEFQIPQKYTKLLEEEQREAKDRQKLQEAPKGPMVEKVAPKEPMAEKEAPKTPKEPRAKKEAPKMAEEPLKEPVGASWLLKTAFAVCSIVIIFWVINLCKTYRAKRKERMQKRLY